MSTTIPTTTEVSPEARSRLNSDVLPLAQHILGSLQLAVEKAVAHDAAPAEFPLPRGASLEAAFVQRLRERPEQSRTRARDRIMPDVRAGSAARVKRHGTLGQIDLRGSAPVLQQATAFAPKLVITTSAPKPGSEVGPAPGPPPDPGPAGTKKPRKKIDLGGPTELQLRLREIRCVDETDGFFGSEAGSDEIALGVIRLDPDAEVSTLGVVNINAENDPSEFKEFDDNVRRVYSPPRVLASWKGSDDKVVMKNGQPLIVHGKQVKVGWPRTYGAMFTLAEIDNGGFPESLQVVCDQARAYIVGEITTKVASAVTNAIGGAIGGAVGAVTAEIVGLIAGWVLGGLIDLIVSIWEDDAFPTVVPRFVRDNPYFWPKVNGKYNATTNGMYWVKAHGGKYEIYFDWNLVR